MLTALILSSPAAMAGPALMPWRFTSSVPTPYGPLQKGTLFGFCFSDEVRIATVTATEGFLKEFRTEPEGPVYSKQIHTRVTLETQVVLKGPDVPTFEVFWPGGTWNGMVAPPPRGTRAVRVGEVLLLSVHPMGPPGEGRFFHNWGTGTLVVDGYLPLPTVPQTEPAAAAAALEHTCATVDFTTP